MSNNDKLEDQRLELRGGLHWFHWVIILMSLVLTVGAWYYASKQLEEKNLIRFEGEIERVVLLLVDRMHTYEEALLAGVAFLKASGDYKYFPFEKWKKFTDEFNIVEEYPGINGLGVINRVMPDELDEYLAYQQQSRPSFKNHPEHDNDVYWPISYVDPLRGNEKAIGLDMAHERNRFTAIEKAKHTGETQVTGPIILVQDAKKTPGFLFYAPYYEKGIPKSKQERMDTFGGIVYAPFIMSKLMEGVLGQEKRSVTLSISDAGEMLYEEHDADQPEDEFTHSLMVPMFGRVWDFDVRASDEFYEASDSGQPITILIGGIIIDSLLLFLFIMLTRSNRNAIEYAKSMNAEALKKNDELIQKAEELLKASEYKTNFLANMSHELRTPLNSLIMLADLLQKDRTENLTPQQLKSATYIHRSGRNLLVLINDILDLSKVEAGQLEVFYAHVMVKDIASELDDMFRPLAVDQNLEFEINREDGLPESIYTDEVRIIQILRNLLSNAFKFTSDGSIIIDIKTKKSNDFKGDWMVFSIKDSGIGMPEDSLSEIFKSFTQIDGSVDRKYEGTGLGLSISRELAALLNCKIKVESVEGEGSQFDLLVPIIKDND